MVEKEEKSAPEAEMPEKGEKEAIETPGAKEEKKRKEEVPEGKKATGEEKKSPKTEPKKEEKPKEAAKKEKPEPEKEEKEVEVPKKFKKIVDEISGMSVLDLSELVKILEKKFGVSPVAVAPPSAAPPGVGVTPSEAAAPVKETFTVLLKGVGDKKIEVIKAVRDITGKGLKDSKDLVDAAASEPQTIKENVKKEEAEEIKGKIEATGASVELK